MNTVTTAAINAVEHSSVGDIEQAYRLAVKEILDKYEFSPGDVAFTACLAFIAGVAAGKHIARAA